MALNGTSLTIFDASVNSITGLSLGLNQTTLNIATLGTNTISGSTNVINGPTVFTGAVTIPAGSSFPLPTAAELNSALALPGVTVPVSAIAAALPFALAGATTPAIIGAGVIVNGPAVVNGATTLNGGLDVAGSGTVSGSLSVGASLSAANLTVSGSADLPAATTIGGRPVPTVVSIAVEVELLLIPIRRELEALNAEVARLRRKIEGSCRQY